MRRQAQVEEMERQREALKRAQMEQEERAKEARKKAEKEAAAAVEAEARVGVQIPSLSKIFILWWKPFWPFLLLQRIFILSALRMF